MVQYTGALSDGEYFGKLRAAGFSNVSLEVTRVYDAEAARAFMPAATDDDTVRQLDGKFVSAFVRARKPPLRMG